MERWDSAHLSSKSGPFIHVADPRHDDKQKLEFAAHEAGEIFFHVRGALVKSKEELFSEMARAMSFPDYFGNNWDALLDCMRDLMWFPEVGYITQYEDPDVLLNCSLPTWETFVRVAGYAGEAWQKNGIAFHLVATGSPAMVQATLAIAEGRGCNHSFGRTPQVE